MCKNAKKSSLVKSIISLILCLSMLLALGVYASAAKIGDVVGNTVYTDIVAKINGYDIESFNINGTTAIVVEDLRNYGCTVQWDETNRSLSVTRANVSWVTSYYEATSINKSMLGKKAYNVLYTDIRTYINGVYVPSYNIGGRTIIDIEYLNNGIGTTYWDAQNRIIHFVMTNDKKKLIR